MGSRHHGWYLFGMAETTLSTDPAAAPPEHAAAADAGPGAAGPAVVLAPYPSFAGSLPPLDTATSADVAAVVAGLVEIVAVEGPVLGHRVRSAYAGAAPGQPAGPRVGAVLDAALAAAVQEGLLVQDDPLGEPDVRARTYRLPDQPVVARELGPRTFDQIPPAELALAMAQAAAALGWDDPVAVLGETIAAYGLRTLGSTNRARLAAVARLVR